MSSPTHTCTCMLKLQEWMKKNKQGETKQMKWGKTHKEGNNKKGVNEQWKACNNVCKGTCSS